MSPRNMARPCARTLDRPIEILGLEPMEMLVVGGAAGAVMFLFDPVPAVVLGLGGAFLLFRLKAGKPPGHLFYLLYRSGMARFLPRSVRPPSLIPPPAPGRIRRLHLSPVAATRRGFIERFHDPTGRSC